MAGEVKLAIILTASMQGGQAFNQAGGGIKGIGAAAKAAVPMLAMFAAYAAFEFLKDSIKIAMEFEQVMAEAGSIVGKTADEMKGMSDAVREMSKEIPQSPKDLGIALYDIYSAGITDSADALNALELSAMTASAGLTDAATAAKAGISTMNAFGMEASELEHIFDVQFLTIKYGVIRYEELAAVIGQLAPSAKNAGQSMESMFATMAILTKQGLNAAEASTALARAMDGLTKPVAIRAAAELGISFVEMTAESIIARDEFLKQKSTLDDLSNSYNRVETDVKSLGEEMAKVSLDEAKNRLEIAKIRRGAEKEGRDISEAEANRIAEIEDANADLAISYSEMSVAQQEARIQSTELNNAMDAQKIATEDAQKAFDDQIAATGNFRPLVDIVEEIGEKYGHLGEAAKADIIGQMFPEVRARRAISGIMGMEQEVIDVTKEMEIGVGAMGEAYGLVTDTATADSKLMQNSMEDLKIEIGEEMMPVMEQWNEIMMNDLIPMIQSTFIPLLESMMPVIRQIAEVVGKLGRLFADHPELLWAIIGAFIAFKAAIAISSLITAVSAAMAALTVTEGGATAATWGFNAALLANPMVWIVVAIIALIAALYLLWKHWDEVTAAFSGFADAVKEKLQPVMDFFGEAFATISGALSGFVEYWKGVWVRASEVFWNLFGEPIQFMLDGIKAYFELIWAGISAIIEYNVALINTIIGGLVSFWDTIIKPALDFMVEFWKMTWDGIVVATEFAIAGIMMVIQPIIDFFTGILIPALDWVVEQFSSAMGVMRTAWDGTIGFLVSAFQPLMDVFNWIIDTLKYIFLGSAWPDAMGIMSSTAGVAVDAVIGLFEGMAEIISGIMDGIKSAIEGIGDVAGDIGGFFGDVGGDIGGLLGFAEGGVVPGPLGSPMPAIVHGGERVFPPGDVVPVKVIGGAVSGTGAGAESHDTYNITLQLGVLPVEETPESIAEKIALAMTEKKMRGATGG